MSGLSATQQRTESRALAARRRDARDTVHTPEPRKLSAAGGGVTSIDAYIVDRRKREMQAAFVETILGRLVRRRNNEELRRIRGFLTFAATAKSKAIPVPRRQLAQA